MPILKILDPDYQYPEDYTFTLDGTVRSHWYDLERLRRTSPLLIAQELDIDFGGSSPKFYDTPGLIEKLLDSCCPPFVVGDLDYLPETAEPQEFLERKNGPFSLWCKLIGGKPPKGWYGLGVDVSGGVEATNSVISVINLELAEKVAHYITNMVKPGPFAVLSVAVAKWFHHEGYALPTIIWENQGPGAQFRDAIRETGYGGYYRTLQESKLTRKITEVVGWGGVGGRGDGKLTLHGNYHRNLGEGRFINRSKDSVLELQEYETGPNGVPFHAGAESEEDPRAAGENHGDLVVADALSSKLLDELCPRGVDKPPTELEYRSTFHWRQQERQKARRESQLW